MFLTALLRDTGHQHDFTRFHNNSSLNLANGIEEYLFRHLKICINVERVSNTKQILWIDICFENAVM